LTSLPAASHRRTVPSAPPEANCLPSGRKATARTWPWCPAQRPTSLPSAGSQMRRKASAPPETTRLPSGLKATARTPLRQRGGCQAEDAPLLGEATQLLVTCEIPEEDGAVGGAGGEGAPGGRERLDAAGPGVEAVEHLAGDAAGRAAGRHGVPEAHGAVGTG